MRNVRRYSHSRAPAIVLEGPARTPGTQQHLATPAQRAASFGGTYNAERRVAGFALDAAGMSGYTGPALSAADRYFMGTLNLRLDSSLRVPGNRWGYVP